MAIDNKKLMEDFNLLIKGEKSEEQFINDLALTYSAKELATWIYLELFKAAQKGYDNKIVITQTEYKKLLSIFKIKGVRGFKPNGEMIMENRGAKDNRPDSLFD